MWECRRRDVYVLKNSDESAASPSPLYAGEGNYFEGGITVSEIIAEALMGPIGKVEKQPSPEEQVRLIARYLAKELDQQ